MVLRKIREQIQASGPLGHIQHMGFPESSLGVCFVLHTAREDVTYEMPELGVESQRRRLKNISRF